MDFSLFRDITTEMVLRESIHHKSCAFDYSYKDSAFARGEVRQKVQQTVGQIGVNLFLSTVYLLEICEKFRHDADQKAFLKILALSAMKRKGKCQRN